MWLLPLPFHSAMYRTIKRAFPEDLMNTLHKTISFLTQLSRTMRLLFDQLSHFPSSLLSFFLSARLERSTEWVWPPFFNYFRLFSKDQRSFSTHRSCSSPALPHSRTTDSKNSSNRLLFTSGKTQGVRLFNSDCCPNFAWVCWSEIIDGDDHLRVQSTQLSTLCSYSSLALNKHRKSRRSTFLLTKALSPCSCRRQYWRQIDPGTSEPFFTPSKDLRNTFSAWKTRERACTVALFVVY